VLDPGLVGTENADRADVAGGFGKNRVTGVDKEFGDSIQSLL
jgi:hypothetical protein